MSNYLCTIGDAAGSTVVQRVLSAETPAAARRALEEQGHAVFAVHRQGSRLRLPRLAPRRLLPPLNVSRVTWGGN